MHCIVEGCCDAYLEDGTFASGAGGTGAHIVLVTLTLLLLLALALPRPSTCSSPGASLFLESHRVSVVGQVTSGKPGSGAEARRTFSP